MNWAFAIYLRRQPRFPLALIILSLLGIDNTGLPEPLKKTLRPAHLRCEYLINPLGIDERNPRLSWLIDADSRTRGQRQSAYQILVASDDRLLAKGTGDLWDSGKVESAQTVNVP